MEETTEFAANSVEVNQTFSKFFVNHPFIPGTVEPALVICLIMTTLFMVGVGAYLIFVTIHPVIYKAFMTFVGFAVGKIVIIASPNLTDKVDYAASPSVLYTLLPILIFCHTLSIDYHTLCRNISHILLISFASFTSHMLFVVLTSYPLLYLSHGWSIGNVILFTTMTSPIISEFTVEELGHVQGQVRQLQLLLQGDQLISTALAFFVWPIVAKQKLVTETRGNVTALFIFEFAVFQLFIGVALGAVCGIAIRYPFKYSYKDIPVQLVLTISGIYFSFFVSELFGGNGSIAVICFGVMLASAKVKVSSAAENFFHHFWPLVLFVLDTIIYFLIGVLHGMVPVSSKLEDGSFVVILYLLIIISRGLAYLILSPIITKSGPQISWQHLIVSVWGVYRGSHTIILSMVFFINRERSKIPYQILTYGILIVLLSMFVNVVLLKNVLNILGLYDLTRTRLVNMNRAMAQVYSCREKGIFSLKMDRVIADANWQVVDKITQLNHPYRNKLDVADMDDDFGDETQKRVIACSDCGTDVVAPPTRKELADITLEAKHRILKAQLVSFWRQYDNGTLSRHGIRVLVNLVESAIVKDDPVLYSHELKLQRDGSKTLRILKKIFGSLLTATSKTHRFIPTNWFRAMCFRICTSRSLQITMACFALVDMILLLQLLTTYFFREYTKQTHMLYAYHYEYFDFIFFGIFAMEFCVQLAGIGMIQYFISHINKIEFAANIIIRTCQVYIYADTCRKEGHMINVYNADYVIMYMKVLLLFRVTRIYIFIVALIPKLLNMVDRQMDEDLMKSYDIGKAYLISLDRVMRFLSHIVSNETVYNHLKNLMERDRLIITRELGLIQKDRPTIAVTIKTKHAIRHVINVMNDCITEMKEEGILDAIENKSLHDSMDRVKKELRETTLVHPCIPRLIIREIPWLIGDPDTTEFFLEHARLSTYDTHEVIIHHGDNPDGLYILASGLVKAYYKPSSGTAAQSTKFGVIPNYDFFINLRFDLPQEEYIVGGNSIGELGIVTRRPYDMKIVCETCVHLYYIPWNVVKAAVHDSGCSSVIQARIWKSIAIKLSLNMLHHNPHFQGWPRERLLLYLQRGLVPILTEVQSVHINEYINDVLLIEGSMMDQATRLIYIAPYYIPRSVQKILLPSHPSWKFKTLFETKIMIIPNAHADQEDLMGPEGLFKDHYITMMSTQDHEEGSEEDACDHGVPKHAKALASRLLQAQRRRQKKVGFMDFTPHVSGPIEGIPAKTTYIIKKDKKKKEIESKFHPRTMPDSKIAYVQDIKEESETGSMHGDDEEDEAKRKKGRHRGSSKRVGRYKTSESIDSRLSSTFGFATGDQDPSDRKLEIHVIESSSDEADDELAEGVQTRLQMEDTFLAEWRRQKSPERPFSSIGGLSLEQMSRSSYMQ